MFGMSGGHILILNSRKSNTLLNLSKRCRLPW